MLYLGRKRIASGGGTTSITAHQFTNSSTDVKSNASSASLGVLDTIVRADHVHPFSDAETFAEAERTKSNNASYGAIMHEKEVKDYAQPLAIYDNSEDISNSSLTTGLEYFTYFKQNFPKIFQCAIGGLQSSNFKTLVGRPANMGNYARCYIIPETFAGASSKNLTSFKLIAFQTGDNGTKFCATARLYNANINSTETIMFSGWECVDGEVEHTVTIYDKDSSDATINKGYTSGVPFANPNVSLDFPNLRALYKKLVIYLHSDNQDNIFELAIKNDGTTYRASTCFQTFGVDGSTVNYFSVYCSRDGTDTTLSHLFPHTAYSRSSGGVTDLRVSSGTSNYYISKVEGVLI